MLCGCLESPFDSTSAASAQQSQRAGETEGDHFNFISSFPGNRRLVKTGGNALVEYDPSKHHNNNRGGKLQIQVTVPPGISGGQAIRVAAPDGKLIDAIVPQGMQSGSTFIVEFPPQTATLADPSILMSHGSLATTSESNGCIKVLPPPPPPVPAPNAAELSSNEKPMILVKVPPNTRAGSTLHVKIPDTDRIVAAQVPAGVSEFYVTYDCDMPVPVSQGQVQGQPNSLSIPPSLPTPIPVPVPTPMPPSPSSEFIGTYPNSNAIASTASSNQQLLLVKVPPNTEPGTTIHVQIPGESTMVAAQVPPGVDEFHVAYTPHDSTGNTNTNAANRSDQANLPPRQSTTTNNGQLPTNSNRARSEEGGNGMEYIIPIVAGTALMGAAGLSILNHGRR